MREHDVTALTTAELEAARRELAASLALARPGSPVRVPIRARMAAIDAELAGRAAARLGVTRLAACPASAGRVPGLREAPRHASCRGVTKPDATRFRRSRAAGRRRAIANLPRRTR